MADFSNYDIPFNKPFIAGKELYYIADAVMSQKIAGDGIYGRKVEAILQERLGSAKILLTTSCTSALEISAILANLKEGDEFIVPSYTFVSTASAFCLRGAKPIFVDIDPKTLCLDVTKVEAAITEKTRAIVPVHYAGMSCDMDALMDIARAHDLLVIEDAAQAIEGYYKGKPLGSFGHAATFSFHETKNINCGEGGALAINDPAWIERAEIIREKGTNRSKFFRGEVDKYSWVDLGSSYVLSDILAAYLKAQFDNLTDIQGRRHALYNLYASELSSLAYAGKFFLPFTPAYNLANGHMFYILLPDSKERDALINHLDKASVKAVFHYVPLHTSPVGQGFGYRPGDLPVTEDISARLLRLPMFVTLTDEEVLYVTNKIQDFYK